MTSRYETVTGRQVDLGGLRARERALLSSLIEEFATGPAEDAFAASWTRKVFPLLSRLPAEQRTTHPLYVVAQDLGFRLGIAQGVVAPPDYRDYLIDRIEERYGSRYKFCQATGIPQAFLSQVLSGSKDFSVATLRRAADALGLSLALVTPRDLADASRDEAATLTAACRSVQDELAVLHNAHDHLRRIRKPARRRAALERERTLFEGLLERLAARLGDLDDEAFGVAILAAIQQERARLEELLTALREQVACVAESGSLAPSGRSHVDREALSRV